MTRSQWLGLVLGAIAVTLIVAQWGDIERYRRMSVM